jgi:hypothetical protein
MDGIRKAGFGTAQRLMRTFPIGFEGIGFEGRRTLLTSFGVPEHQKFEPVF